MQQLNRAMLLLFAWSCAAPLQAVAEPPPVVDRETGEMLSHEIPQLMVISPDSSDPFDRLFEPLVSGDVTPAPLQPPVHERQPRTICGMVVLPADPSIDPQMQLEPPADARFTIRTVRPQICGSE